MSGLMSGDGKRDGALASAPAPILDSTRPRAVIAADAMRLASFVRALQAKFLGEIIPGFVTSFYIVGLVELFVHKILCIATHPVSAVASTGAKRWPLVAIARSRSIKRRKIPCSA